MPAFYPGYPPQYFEPKYEGHPSLRNSHLALNPASNDMDLDPYDHSKYPSSASSSFNNYAAYYAEPFCPPHQAAAAPMIQPSRIDDRYTSCHASSYRTQRYHDQPAFQEPPAEDEKITGGVAAQLDYDMNLMIDFVVEMASGIIRPTTYDIKMFRKWVAQVLNATRLPSATVVLSLSYLALRVRGLSAKGQYHASERGLYQMLTVALILGSKFLDDNTFQNKSWAEVSNINVVELNTDEREWLVAFEHRLHHDPTIADGFDAWEKQWLTYKNKPAASSSRLHPLDTAMNSARKNSSSPSRYQRSYPATTMSSIGQDSMSSRGRYTPSYSPYESWYGRPGLTSSPSSAPHTGPNTPEYYPGQDVWGARDYRYGYAPTHQYSQPKSAWPSYELSQPSYAAPSMWNSHGHMCSCTTCRYTQPFQPRYGPLTAA